MPLPQEKSLVTDALLLLPSHYQTLLPELVWTM
jgi:hypothetical protein